MGRCLKIRISLYKYPTAMAHAAPNQIVVKMWPADSGSVKNCDFLEVIKSNKKQNKKTRPGRRNAL